MIWVVAASALQALSTLAAVAGGVATVAPWSLAAPPSVRRMNLEVLAAAHGAMVGSREKEEDVVLSSSSGWSPSLNSSTALSPWLAKYALRSSSWVKFS